MARWHFSRNKALLFCAALFISLAIGIHLCPYFPSVTKFVTSVQSVVVFDNRDDSCINLVNEVVWEVKPRRRGGNVLLHEPLKSSNDSRDNNEYDIIWNWARMGRTVDCRFKKMCKADALKLFQGSWIVVAGDSQARLTAQSLLNLVVESKQMESLKEVLFKRHSDYQFAVKEIGMKLDFIWAPYATNLTQLANRFRRSRSQPDVVVMGAGLWDMLHVTNATEYGAALQSLRRSIISLLLSSPKSVADGSTTRSSIIKSPCYFWHGMPLLINGMLNTREKRMKMSDETWHDYDRALQNSRLLRKHGGPFLPLDIQSLSWNCGPRCTSDGMHYDGAIHDATAHILLNALLVESRQKL